jgi:hypothetical protein
LFLEYLRSTKLTYYKKEVILDSGEKNPLRGFSKKNRVECTVGFFLLYKHRTEKEC